MEKYGIVTKDSHSDFDMTKKADFYDSDGFGIADKKNKKKLKNPKPIEELKEKY